MIVWKIKIFVDAAFKTFILKLEKQTALKLSLDTAASFPRKTKKVSWKQRKILFDGTRNLTRGLQPSSQGEGGLTCDQ